jgi:predicted nucleic acid-binding protein
MDAAVWVEPAITVSDCRDAKDNKYLELVTAAGADLIVSSDDDLLVQNPWRRVRILRPAEFLGWTPLVAPLWLWRGGPSERTVRAPVP